MKLLVFLFLSSLSLLANDMNSSCYLVYNKDSFVMLRMDKKPAHDNLYQLKMSYPELGEAPEAEVYLARRARCIDCNQDIFQSTVNSELQIRVEFNGKIASGSETGTLTMTFESSGDPAGYQEKLKYQRVKCYTDSKG